MIVRFVRGQRRPLWYAVFAIVTSCVMISTMGVLYTRHATTQATNESEHKWCAIVKALDDSWQKPVPPDTPPATIQLRQTLAAQMHRLRTEFHCD